MTTLPIAKFRTSLLTAAVLVLAALPSISHAQAADFHAKVTVPFAFEVGHRHFAPGKYTIKMLSDHIMAISSGAHTAQFMTMWDTTQKPVAQSQVVFHKYGNRYFIAEVWNQADATHLKCVQSSAEQQAQRSLRLENVVRNDIPTTAANVKVALLTRQ